MRHALGLLQSDSPLNCAKSKVAKEFLGLFYESGVAGGKKLKRRAICVGCKPAELCYLLSLISFLRTDKGV